ncbi:MAG: EamA family transporter [Atopobiaceae bacterium]|nr:EamA family transporter [Atopobiaceae bacterium]
MREETKGTLLSLFGASCWGVSGCVGQYLFQYEGISSLWLAPVRLGLAGVLLFAFYVITDRERLFGVWKDPLNVRDLLVYGILGVSLCQLSYLVTIQLSSAAVATILQATAPALILVYTCFRGKRLPTLFELFAEILALVGVFLLSTHGNPTSMAISPLVLAIGLGGAVCVAVYTLVPRRMQQSYPTPLLQCWAFLMGGVLFSCIFHPWTDLPEPTVGLGLGIFAAVVIGNVFGYSCYLAGAKIIGAQRASLISFAEPVVAAIISTTLLGSPFTAWDAAGFICLFGMLVMIVSTSQRDPEEDAPEDQSL